MPARKPGADKDFEERFTKEMREQLMLGPYFMSSLKSIDKNARLTNWPTEDLNGIYAITAFLILNIFLGSRDILVPHAGTPERSRSAAGARIDPVGREKVNFRRDVAVVIYRQHSGCKYLHQHRAYRITGTS